MFFPRFFFLMLIFCASISMSGQPQQMKFEQLSMEHGLSQTSVTSILQDSQGFMWFGTEDGLNKYDGYRFTIYQHIPGDSTSLSGNVINTIVEDKTGTIWLGTSNGLSKYDPKNNSFKQYRNNPDNSNSLSNDNVLSMVIDESGYLWLGTVNGLNKFDPVNNRFRYITPLAQVFNGLLNISSLIQSDSKKLWVGTTNNGLYQFDPNTEEFSQLKNPDGKMGGNTISSVFEKQDGNLLVGTYRGLFKFDPVTLVYKPILVSDDRSTYPNHAIYSIFQSALGHFWLVGPQGLIRYDDKAEKFRNIPHRPNDPHGLRSVYIKSVFEDAKGVLWIGSFGGGVYKYDPLQWQFDHYINDPIDSNSLSENSVRAIMVDQNKFLWIGTRDGLNRFDRRSGKVAQFKYQPENQNSLSSNGIRSLYQDSKENLWVGTWASGLNKLHPVSGKITRYRDLPNDSIPLLGVRSLAEDDAQNLWLATTHGLVRVDLSTEQFTRYIPETNLVSLHVDDQSHLWLGTAQSGLLRFEIHTETFTSYPPIHNNPKSISHNYVTAILEGKQGTLWVGTYGGGLNKLDKRSGQFQHYNTTHGLPNDVIYGITQDDHGFLWISNNKGICRFDPINETFKTYGVEDGLQSNEFNSGAYFKHKSGEMFFGGINGFNVFHPDSIKDNHHIPKIVFTDFQIFNKPVAIDSNAPLNKSVGLVDEITLSHDQSVFSFEFVALNYTHPGKNQYAYKLEGFDQDWQYLGNRNFITFTNLDPGAYTLKVKGSNNDGVWNEQGASIALVITPPWWRTWWAYFLYAMTSLFVLWLWRSNVIRRERLKAQFQLEHLKLEKIEELDRVKSTVFENISHEFRTPLTLILGTTEQALSAKTSDHKQKQGYGVIHRSAQRLLSLINQLLDLSKLEAGSVDLQAGKYDLIGFLKPITAAFSSLAQSREVHFLTNLPYDHLYLFFDKDKLEKVINNLLANAFKFTEEKGHVAITVSKHTADESEKTSFELGFVKITIEDNGQGIDQDQVDKIFDRFYQVNDSSTREHEGTGIGLALSKELVELHYGEIQVESRLKKGSTFKVLLPIGKEHLKESEVITDEPKSAIALNTIPGQPTKLRSKQVLDGLPRIMVVEDNEEMRDYIEDILSGDYAVIKASNGKEALIFLNDNHPDLIISDVMMPKMDGITFCKEIKRNQQTNHIPIVMLTARADQGSKEEGLEIGADAYLTKPFGTKELLVRVKNLLGQRELMKDHFKKEIFLQPKEVAITSKDEEFLNKVMESIDQHLGDEYFNVDQLAKEVGLSKPQITKKLNMLTEHTPNQLIQKFRLDRAKELLLHDAGRIAEIAYEVGFSSPAYFTKVFKEKFGMSPREFKKGD